ncbi:MAG: TrkH family potassium uptake protein [Eubacteriales bacterium]|nr:TrkH family potassium uptake protein [Eubacteriales bacterium]
MNYKMIGRVNALILAVEAAFMFPALLICLWDRDFPTALAFWHSILLTLAASGILALFSRKARRGFYAREGLVCVGISWIIMSLLGCLPFYLSGQIPHYIDALFEIVSGFTTTGASVVADVEVLTRGVLYWRSFSHWLGGMGVLVFLLAIIPLSGRNDGFTMHLLRAESPGPNVGKLVPRMRQTAMILYLIYILLTILTVLFLLAGKMPLFDAVCTAFGTAGTGGFGIKSDSMAGYSPYLQNVCTVFMLLFGVNFSCYFLLLLRRFRSVWQDEELRIYLAFFVGSTALITWNLRGFYETIGETVRHAAFQVSSIMTTTGFATVDFDAWPSFSKAILLCLMIVGACAGSTGGGMKCIRVLLLLKIMRRNIQQVLHPQKIQVIRVNGQVMSEKILGNTNAYLAAYVVIVISSFLIVSLDGFSITTNLSAVLACFNNIGPGLELVGPAGNFGSFSILSKLVLILNMLAGRLEIFPMLVLLSRSTWKHQ